MATTLVTNIDSLVFLSDLEVIQMSSNETSVAVTVCDSRRQALFSTVLYPHSNGSVSLFDIDRIIKNSLRDSATGSFSIWVNGEAICFMTVIRSDVKLSLPATEWTLRRFLTAMTGERDTAVGRLETLSCYNPDRLPCRADCLYLSPAGRIVARQVAIGATETTGDVTEYDVSPRRFVRDGYELVHFTVRVGDMAQAYRVIVSPPPLTGAFLFRNNFNCWETLHCHGEVTADPQYSRVTAMVNGSFEAYDIGETDKHVASTGVMRFGAESIARDLARSGSVYLLNPDGTPGERVIITDCSVADSNAYDFTPSFSFTYRLARRGASDLDGFRIFDHTFDPTYE